MSDNSGRVFVGESLEIKYRAIDSLTDKLCGPQRKVKEVSSVEDFFEQSKGSKIEEDTNETLIATLKIREIRGHLESWERIIENTFGHTDMCVSISEKVNQQRLKDIFDKDDCVYADHKGLYERIKDDRNCFVSVLGKGYHTCKTLAFLSKSDAQTFIV